MALAQGGGLPKRLHLAAVYEVSLPASHVALLFQDFLQLADHSFELPDDPTAMRVYGEQHPPDSHEVRPKKDFLLSFTNRQGQHTERIEELNYCNYCDNWMYHLPEQCPDYLRIEEQKALEKKANVRKHLSVSSNRAHFK